MLLHSSPGVAADVFLATENDATDFTRDIFPILQRSCIECHGAAKQEGGLRLDQQSAFLDSGIVGQGTAHEGEFLRRIGLPKGHDEIMPAIGEPLSRSEISTLRQWVEAGANWPEDFRLQTHWSYMAPVRPAVPQTDIYQSSYRDWCNSPIDRFVLSKLEREGLSPAPPATAEKLVRRLFFDLIGLPPTPDEVEEFLANESANRVEELIDQLMQRPEFGERWARPWLDLARYADSHGFQRDDLRDIWAYRDWVIDAFNADMPFDQFTIEQIAGDLIPNATEAQKIATGFHRCAPTNVEAGSLPEETRVEQVLDRVNTTGAVWLGTTLECCQCHDHKYDPFTIKDYYRLFAFFNSTEREADRADEKSPSSIKFNGPSMPLSHAERDSKRAELHGQLAVLKEQQMLLRAELDQGLSTWLQDFRRAASDVPQVFPLAVDDFRSEGTTDSARILEDGEVLLVGNDPPEQDHYTFRVSTNLTDIRAFRLDALQHASLPGMGPGRGDPVRRNFVLNEFAVQLVNAAVPSPNAAEVLDFASAKASFSQKSWDVEGAVGLGKSKGWAISPQFDESHWAMFVLSNPLTVPAGYALEFSMKQAYGSARTIGCFRISAVTGNLAADSIPADIVALAALPASKLTNKQRAKLLDYRLESDVRGKKLAEQSVKLEKQIAAIVPDTTLVMIELPQARPSTVFMRGDYRTPGDQVKPGTPSFLHALDDDSPNRLSLAKWLVSTENPLVARVAVNRYWTELFGEGIVATVEDFGVKGETPSHPELLDWLAVEFMEQGWSTKKLLKTILMSSTYQQSSVVTTELLERDPNNRLLARGPRNRMDAETIRDNALSIAGLLSLNKAGPPIRPFQPAGIWSKVGGTAYNYEVSPGAEQYRRGVYVVLKRGSPYPSFTNFDASSRLACTVKRSRTNTPLQALTLLNDPVYVSAASALAERIQEFSPQLLDGFDPLDAKLDFAFQCCTARRPTTAERETLRNLFLDQVGSHAGTELTQANAQRAWSSVATVLLNLHETITKD
jgi:hypothetical protein